MSRTCAAVVARPAKDKRDSSTILIAAMTLGAFVFGGPGKDVIPPQSGGIPLRGQRRSVTSNLCESA